MFMKGVANAVKGGRWNGHEAAPEICGSKQVRNYTVGGGMWVKGNLEHNS